MYLFKKPPLVIFLSVDGHLQQSLSGNALMTSLCPAFPFYMVKLAPANGRNLLF